MGWKLERIPLSWEKRRCHHVTYLWPVRWEWESYFSSHGLMYGYALTKRTAERHLSAAERELLSGR
jgi:hypothetical protein